MQGRRLTLITGGARSGKSSFALRLASASDDVLFVATAEPGDDDIAARIARHRRERPPHWRTIEAPLAVPAALAAAEPAGVVVLDCATLWVSNMLLTEGASWEAASAELAGLLEWHAATAAHLIVVSNEVGLGIVPGDPLSRTYRDWLGRFNQRLAAAADAVYLLVAGLPVNVKALAADTDVP